MERKVIRDSIHDKYAYSLNTTDGWNFDSHIHGCYEFIYIMEGNFFYTVEGNEYLITPGDMIITNPDEMHSFSFPEICTYTRQFLHIYPALMADFPQVLEMMNKRKFGTYNYVPAVLVNEYKLADIFNGLQDYCAEKLPERELMVIASAIQLMIKLDRIVTTENLSTREIKFNKNTAKICSYIDKNFKNNISLDSISEHMFLAKPYICRLFKNDTGMTIHSYMNMRRIVYAKNLILSGENASNVYSECGFNDYSTFYRSFQKYVGMTPENFKHSHPSNT